MITTVGRWTIEHDPDRTAACYATTELGPPCGCAYCRNFVAATEESWVDPLRLLIAELGIDVCKPASLTDYFADASGKRLTLALDHVVGEIRSGADGWSMRGESFSCDFERCAGFELGFTVWSRDSTIGSFEGHPDVYLSFWGLVPWVLPEQPEQP